VLYVGVGRLQEAVGLTSAMVSSFLLIVPAALLVLQALRKTVPRWRALRARFIP
jgi:hypothetical protein